MHVCDPSLSQQQAHKGHQPSQRMQPATLTTTRPAVTTVTTPDLPPSHTSPLHWPHRPASPHVHEQPARLLEQVLPKVAELCDCCPIHHAVVPSPADSHDVAFDQVIRVRVVPRQGLHPAQGHNGSLRRVQHGGGSGAAHGAWVVCGRQGARGGEQGTRVAQGGDWWCCTSSGRMWSQHTPTTFHMEGTCHICHGWHATQAHLMVLDLGSTQAQLTTHATHCRAYRCC